MSSLNVAIYDAMVAAWDSKYLYRRPRPSDLSRSLTTAIPNPRSPSYPSEHAVAAGAASAVLAFFFPQQAAFFNAKAEEAGHSRLLAGVQYPSDVQAGLELGRGGSVRHRARRTTTRTRSSLGRSHKALVTGKEQPHSSRWPGRGRPGYFLRAVKSDPARLGALRPRRWPQSLPR